MLRTLPILILTWGTAVSIWANPTGGEVAAGSASVAGQGSATVTVNQASNTAIINWQTFSIASGETTKFIQPSSTSAALNRVLGGQTSFIDGTLSANGQIYLLNGNGIVIGQSGVITTAGFTGSTRNIADSDFLSGNFHFVGSSDGGVTNYGTISALGGDVVLIGQTVDNKGTINATGTAGLVAGNDILLAQQNADGSTITVNPVSSADATKKKVGVKNSGTIKASAAELKAANGNIYALAIKNDGMIQATTVAQQGGHIYLTADSGTIVNSGTLDASATAAKGAGGSVVLKSTAGKVVHSGKIVAQGGQGGTGGNVDISGSAVSFTGTVDLTAQGGTTGDFLLDPTNLQVVSGTNDSTTISGTAPNETNNSADSTITNGTVNNALATSNLTLSATDTITVSAPITWTSANTLTLTTSSASATEPVAIQINAAIQGTSGRLVLDATGSGSLREIATNANGVIDVSRFILQQGAWFQLADEIDSGADNGGDIPQITVNNQLQTAPLPAFTASTDFEIGGNATFLRADGGNGGTVYYALVDIYGVQGINGFLNSNFTEQANADIDGTYAGTTTSTWNIGAGFIPIGTVRGSSTVNPYNGQFSSSYIQDVTIDYTGTSNPTGLIAELGPNGTLNGVTIANSTVTGNNQTGGLVGVSYGNVYGGGNSYTTVNGANAVGGVIGDNYGYASPSFSGTVNGSNQVGGIAGINDTGSVSGPDTGSTYYSGQIEDGNSTGAVNGSNSVGGVMGENDGYTDGDYSSATVTGDSNVGGIAGSNYGTIDSAIAAASLQGASDNPDYQYDFGGIAGINEYLGDSYATISNSTVNGGSITLNSNSFTPEVGGIAGENDGLISSCSVLPGETLYGNQDVGGLAGANYGMIVDSYNSAAVTGVAFPGQEGGNSDVGGLVGYNSAGNEDDDVSEDFRSFSFTADTNVSSGPPTNPSSYSFQFGTIQTSYNTGTVTGGANVGGLAGDNDYGGTIQTAYNVGSVTGSSDVGGIAGTNNGYIYEVYNSGAVGTGTVGGLVGYEGYGSDVENSYWDTTTSHQLSEYGTPGGYENNIASVNSGTAYTQSGNNNGGGNDGDGTGYSYFGASSAVSGAEGVYAITDPNAGTPDGYSGNTSPSWYMIEGQTRPMLAMEFNETIQSPHQLELINVYPSGSYSVNATLVNYTIDMSVTTNPSEVWNSTGFYPIGGDPDDDRTPFSGSFYGGGVTLAGLFINDTGDFVGLFGETSGGSTVEYVTLSDGSITGHDDVGGIVGSNGGTVNSVTNYSDGSASITGANQVGGIVGDNFGTVEFGYNNSGDPSGNPTVSGTGNNIGGIVGSNETNGLVEEDDNNAPIAGGSSSSNVGGVAGINYQSGTVTLSLNTGSVGTGVATDVGGVVGRNGGQVDDSYNGGSTDNSVGTVSGHADVGGLVGGNDTSAVLETSYNTGLVSAATAGDNGTLIGTNHGQVYNVYWSTSNDTNEAPGIAHNLNAVSAQVVDHGYTNAQLADARNFAQGAAPMDWNFAPPATNTYGAAHGDWAVDEYQSYYSQGQSVVAYQVAAGLPVLQWQYPVSTQISATNGMTPYPNGENHGTEPYGYQPGYTATGYGASELSTVEYNGVTEVTSGGSNAGDTQNLTVSGAPTPGYAIEYVPGTVDIVPDDLTITANSYTIPSGSPAPDFTATYSGFQPNGSPSDLSGTLTFTLDPLGVADGIHTITPSGQYSSNYVITYLPGVLNVSNPSPTQEVLTFQTELDNIVTDLTNDPTSGIDPLFFIIFPNETGLGGELIGAINDDPDPTDYAYASGSSNLPAFDRLVTPGVGVVEIIDGVIVVGCPETGNPVFLGGTGGCLPQDAMNALRGVLSSGAYNQLFSLTHGTTH